MHLSENLWPVRTYFQLEKIEAHVSKGRLLSWKNEQMVRVEEANKMLNKEILKSNQQVMDG